MPKRITLKQALKCQTCHPACDCREYRYQRMRDALEEAKTEIGLHARFDFDEWQRMSAERVLEIIDKALEE